MKSKGKLDPELQQRAEHWTHSERVEVARKLERWARQLHISASPSFSEAARPHLKQTLPDRWFWN